MSDLTGTVVSAPRLAASTDTVVVRVVSASGASLAGAFDMSLSRSWTDPAAWVTASNTAGMVSLLVGPDSVVGELASGTWIVYVRQGDAVVLAGPFVITGGDATPTPPDDGDYDGGEVT